MSKRVILLLVVLFGSLSVFAPPATKPAEAVDLFPGDIKCTDFWDKEENAKDGCSDPFTHAKDKLSDAKDVVVDNTVGAAFGYIKTEFAVGAAGLFKEGMGWWVSQESLLTENIGIAQNVNGYFGGITLVMALIGFAVAAIKTMVSGRGHPLGDALKALGIFASAAVGGLLLVEALTYFTDALAVEIMAKDVQITESSTKVEEALKGLSFLSLLFVAPLMLIGSLMQFILMALRDVSLVLMAGMIPIAAAGQFYKFSRPWLFRLFSAMFAVILYKPVAAIAYTIAFDLFLNASGIRAVLTAVLMVVGASFTIKPLMALFQFTGVSLLDKSGGSNVSEAARQGTNTVKNHKTKQMHKNVSSAVKQDTQSGGGGGGGRVTMTKQVPQNQPGSINDAAKKEMARKAAKKMAVKAATKGAG